MYLADYACRVPITFATMTLTNIQIKETNDNDFKDIMEVETKAFGGPDEAKLTADLLSDPSAEPVLSLLAFHEGEAIGHILFTRAYIDEMENQPMIHILAPLAVKPNYQKQGVGGKLIEAGLEILKERGTELVFVLGHIDYYPRYGFINDAKNLGFPAPYSIPEEVKDAWMIQSLVSDGLKKYRGEIRCADAMNKEEYWRE